MGIGDLQLISSINNESIPITLHDVAYIPNSSVTLISQIILENKGCRSLCTEDDRYLYTNLCVNGKQIIKSRRFKNSLDLYETNLSYRQPISYLNYQQLHKLMAHASPNHHLKKTVELSNGIEMDGDNKSIDCKNCDTCVQSKSKRRVFNHSLIKSTTQVGFVLHSDVNYMQTRSIGGKKYAVIFVDEASRYKRIYYLSKLDGQQMLEAIIACFRDQYNDLGYIPSRLHADNGTNYLDREVQKYLAIEKVQFTSSTPDNHEQNGLAERSEQDITAKTKSLLIDEKLPNRIWTVAMSHAIYLTNRTYHSSIDKTPFECYFGQKPNLKNLRKFGEKLWVHQHKNHKLSPTSILMRFAGYTESSVNYWVMDLKCNRLSRKTSVTFIESDGKNENNSDRISLPIQLFEENNETESDASSQSLEIEDEESDNETLDTPSNNSKIGNDNQLREENNQDDQSLAEIDEVHFANSNDIKTINQKSTTITDQELNIINNQNEESIIPQIFFV